MRKIIIYVLLACLSLDAVAQISITGSVLDSVSKLPISGVVVQILETKKKTVTDAKGDFNFTVDSGKYTLSIRGIGYKAKSEIVNAPEGKKIFLFLAVDEIALKDVEIVSTGYQNTPRERATGSFSTLDNSILNQQVSTDIISRLEGITPTLSVDRTTNNPGLMIRGLSSLRADRSPLIVLDNFPYEGDINNINPNDIENITILKDGAAASIWGVKAGNGVIVINTKKGQFNRPLKVDASATHSISQGTDLMYQNRMSTSDYIDIERMLFNNGYYNSSENSSTRSALTPVVELLIANRDGLLTDTDLENQINNLRSNNVLQNYMDNFYTPVINRQYALDFSGGSEKKNWRIFAGYDHNTSELSATYERMNFKVDNNFKIGKRLDISLSLLANYSKAESGRTSFPSITTSSGQIPSYTTFTDENGNALPVMATYRASAISGLGIDGLLDWNYYPLTNGDYQNTTSNVFDVLANLKLNYTILKGLKFSGLYQFERQEINNQTRYSQESYYVRNLVNQYTQVVNGVLSWPIPNNAIWDFSDALLNVHNLRGQLSYDEDWNDFTLSAIAGSELRNAVTSSSAYRSYGIDENIYSSVSVDYLGTYPNILTGGNAYIPFVEDYNLATNNYVSFFANAGLTFKQKYGVSASLRRDASNLFGVSTNNRWNPLWSAGGSWEISAENWFPKAVFQYARLRATYGRSGNTNPQIAAVTTISYSGTNPYTRTQLANFSNYANPDLRWERVKTLNLAADLRVLKNRLNLSIDYYIKKSDDLIGTDIINPTAGIGSTITRNTAAISARGLDIELTSQNTLGAFRWKTSAFANFYRDRVDDYYLASQPASSFVSGNISVTGVEGYPVYTVMSYAWAGLNPTNGNPRGYVNGSVSEDYETILGNSTTIDDLVYTGPAFPTTILSLGNSFSFKDFNLDFRITGKFGYYFRRDALSYASLYTSREGNGEYADRWQNPGDELWTDVPSQMYPNVTSKDTFYQYSEATVESGNHIRFQYLSLGYNFKKEKYSFLPFKNVSLKFMASNLGLLYLANDYGIDPDFPSTKPVSIYSLNLKIQL